MFSQLWWEESGEEHPYDLSGYRFLVVLGEDRAERKHELGQAPRGRGVCSANKEEEK